MKNPFIKLLSLFAVSAILFTSCSSKAYIQRDDTVDLSQYKTFAWSETQEVHEQNKHNDIQESKIRNAVNQSLISAGWREDPANPDAVLAYDVLVERNTRRTSDPVYTPSYSRMYYNPYTRRLGTLYYPSRFAGYNNSQYQVTEGTLTVSLIDAKTDKTFWQGWTTKEVNTKLLSDQEIESSVKSIFKKFSK
ncbi:MAG: DUF4136 domain-containing protein [Bacteroidota bacterium]